MCGVLYGSVSIISKHDISFHYCADDTQFHICVLPDNVGLDSKSTKSVKQSTVWWAYSIILA